MAVDELQRVSRAKGLTRVNALVAPLLVFSVGLHGLLLLIPLPPPAAVEEEAPPEEEFVDLLSLGSLPAQAPEAEPLDPPPAAPVPPAPNQPVIAPPAPAAPPPTLAETPLPPDPEAPPVPEPGPAAAVVPNEEVADLFSRLTRGSGDSDFDSTAIAFPSAAYLTPGGIREWSPSVQGCFFTQISAETYSTPPKVVSLRYLTRNVQFLEQQDIPRTFPPPQFQVSSEPGGYCNHTLFRVVKDGQPFLFISLVGIGVGAPGQQASGLVIIWSSDPRTG
jgi:hypothetical protein